MKRTSHSCAVYVLLLNFIGSFGGEALYLGVAVNAVLEGTLVIEFSYGIANPLI